MANREGRAYKITWLMPLGMGGGYGVLEEDMPKGMEHAGNQQVWRNQAECGMAVCQALQGAGFNVADVEGCSVYMQRRQGRAVYWVPYARWYRHSKPAGYQTHYIPVRVEEAPLPAEVASRIQRSRAAPEHEERRRHAAFFQRLLSDPTLPPELRDHFTELLQDIEQES